MSIIEKLFGDQNKKYLKKLNFLVEKINSLETEFESFSNEQIQNKTKEFKQRLNDQEALDNLLPECFALVREAAKRTLNQRHFDVQLIGGIALHEGRIAEMKTGEGKTLTAVLPLYLNGLTEKGAHLITVNDYLAKRDAVWMGQIFHLLGLKVGCIVHETSYIYDPDYQELSQETDKERDEQGGFKVIEKYLKPVSRKQAYSADVTYGTNNEFGFDYLRDNMAHQLSSQVQRGFNYVIIDEVDSVLIDEARTPLIISAADMESSQFYQEFARIIPKLSPETDYQIDEKIKTVTLTEQGVNKIEKILGLENIYQEKGIKYLRYLEQSLKAQAIVPSTNRPFFARDYQYVVKNNEIIIVDEFTGRLMPGRRWSGGLHQAIEAKENVEINPESLTLASVTFQNYFRMYQKLSGMTGTAVTSAEEFDKVYKLEVAIVPTNKTMIRENLPDKIYKTFQGKMKAVVQEIKEKYEKGQPVLVGTTSIEKNEYIGKLLEREGIDHEILNAKHHEREGEIIAQAGRFKQITIATNMAGRGVDIVLGGNPIDAQEAKKVKSLGGLHVIGTERHEARRIDNQLRGRTGRQGDPGSSQFFLSLEDDLMRVFASDKIKLLMTTLKIPEDQPIEAKIISGAIESAQAKIEGMNFDLRKHILEYDDVMNKHREIFYKKRKDILEKSEKSLLKDYVLEIIKKHEAKEKEYLIKEQEIGLEKMRQIEKVVCLRTLDMLWLEHLENMDYLRDSVKLRAYGQRDPLVEYKAEGHRLFQDLLSKIELNIAKTILKVNIVEQPRQTEVKQPFFPKKQLGRNDPCFCNSGKKYKKCHGQ